MHFFNSEPPPDIAGFLIKTGLILVFALSLTACNETHRPENLIPEPAYTNLLMDVVLTQYYIGLYDLGEKRDSLMADTFGHYGVTEEQFEASHTYYQRDPESQRDRVDSIRQTLMDERQALYQERQESAGRE